MCAQFKSLSVSPATNLRGPFRKPDLTIGRPVFDRIPALSSMVRDTQRQTFAVVGEVLAFLGFEEIGQGYFSRVYAHPADPTKVVKIGVDMAYAEFLQLAEATPSKHLPVIHRSERAETTRTGQKFETQGGHEGPLLLTVMERLKEYSGLPSQRLTIDTINAKTTEAMGTHSGWFSEQWVRNLKTTKLPPKLLELTKQLAIVAVERNLTPDIHSGNVMFRGSTPVVTDPFS